MSHLGVTFGLFELPFLSHLGVTLVFSSSHFRILLGSLWVPRSCILEPSWGHLGLVGLLASLFPCCLAPLLSCFLASLFPFFLASLLPCFQKPFCACSCNQKHEKKTNTKNTTNTHNTHNKKKPKTDNITTNTHKKTAKQTKTNKKHQTKTHTTGLARGGCMPQGRALAMATWPIIACMCHQEPYDRTKKTCEKHIMNVFGT